MPAENTFLFSAKNDYDVWSMLVVEPGGDDWVAVGHGMVDPDGKPIIFDRQQLPMTLASASEIADEAIQTYHDIDLSDYADDEDYNQGVAEGQLNEGEQLFYARNPDGTRTYARIKDSAQLAQLQQKYAGSEVKLMSFNRPDVAEWLVSRGVNMRGFLPGMVITRGLSEEENKPERPEADYGDDYQDMVARVKKLAGLGPLKTVYDPQKRVYKNVPTAVQPKKEQ